VRTRISTAGKRRNSQGGFTYVAVLAAVVVAGILVETATTVTSHVVQAEREAELLFRGQAYRNAIKSYYEAGQSKTYPRSLEDLVRDPRFPNKRHIRVLYPEPMTMRGKGEWVLVHAPNGGIAGVSSPSTAAPIKQGNFPKDLQEFSGATSYSEWIFQYQPLALPSLVKPATSTSTLIK
jgi:type II secretory pathway pseudopilin PulG